MSRIRRPVGYFTAFSGDLTTDLDQQHEPRTDRLWLAAFDRVAAPDLPSILAHHRRGVAVNDAEFAEGLPPTDSEFAAITPELLRAVHEGLVRSLDDESDHYAETA